MAYKDTGVGDKRGNAGFAARMSPVSDWKEPDVIEPSKVRTCLWFDGNGVEAARLYVSLLPGSKIDNPASLDAAKPPMTVHFTLAGTPYMILNGGPQYRPSEAASIFVTTDDQAETDRLWDALAGNGGKPGRCGWLKDRYGVSWQIVPRRLPELLSGSRPEIAGRVMHAMMQMAKIDIAVLEAAANTD